MTEAIATPKFVQEYQATDADGNPIGNLTHLEADTQEELIEKLKEAHINASRALHRQNQAFSQYKKLKVTPAPAAPQQRTFTPEEEQARKAAGTAELEARVARQEAELADQKRIKEEYIFLGKHRHDFYACQANANALYQYLKDNNLDHTADNFEIAFAEIGDSLAKDPKTSVQNNPTIVTQNPVVTPDPQKPRQPSFGVQPGTGSGQRPSGKSTAMTKKDILAKKKAEPQWWKTILKDPAKVAEINAILANG